MRQREPFWKSSHKCYYFKHNGRDVRLDPDLEKARKKWHQIVGGTQEVTKDTPLIELTNRFLAWSEANNARSTFEKNVFHLKCFHKHVGNIQFSTLKQYHVTRWLERRYRKSTSPSTVHTAVRCVQRMLNWNKKQGWVSDVPVFEKPTPISRDVYLMPDEFDIIVSLIADEEFRDIVTIMRETGCRPQEARRVEARHFKGDRWEFPVNEAKGKREIRIVLLNKKALAITQRLVAKYPEGPLFRNRRGRRWTKDALDCRCYRLRQVLREKKGLTLRICPYAIRHTFATDAIIRGVDLISIQNIMGHKDLRMLSRIYQHVMRRSEHMKKALEQATSNEPRKAG